MSQASDHSDAVSDTSTERYDQEAYSTFSTRVLSLAHQRLWPDADVGGIEVTRMRGGGYNRITGISRIDPNKSAVYILRSPRYPEESIDGQVAVLTLLRSADKDIPVPRIIAYDLSYENELQSTYMVQHRIPGMSLCDIFDSLNHPQKCKLARELGTIRKKLLSVRSNRMGTVGLLQKESTKLDEDLGVAPFTMKHLADSQPIYPPMTAYHSAKAIEPNPFEFFTQTFSAYIQSEESTDPHTSLEVPYLEKMIEMVSQINENGWLEDPAYCLAHMDFEDRDIMVQVDDATEHHNMITGILDWDDAVFAPCFVSCAPPVWLWAWDELIEDDTMDHRAEWSSHLHPITAEGKELKHIFDEAAGEVFQNLAYEPVYKICRGLFRVARHVINQQYILDDIETMLTEWRNIKPS